MVREEGQTCGNELRNKQMCDSEYQNTTKAGKNLVL